MYKTINGWTKQTMIDHIKREFKGKSYTYDEYCLYRGPEGKKCAVGMFIPDDKYNSRMESKNADLVIIGFRIGHVMPLSESNMRELQLIHDNSHPDETLNDMLTWIEKKVAE